MRFAGSPNTAGTGLSVLALAATILLAGGVASLAAGPFARLAGEWRGGGQIELSDGSSEPLRCRAAYDVLGAGGNELQLNIRCAGQSYSFDLRGSVTSDGNRLSGTWSESTRNASGTISGTVRSERFQVVARGQSFAASLTLVTHGHNQSVTIRSADPQSEFKGASLELQRASS
jgi:hypothetical protein